MMQKTNFLFEVLVHDDASTDGTVDIIREYETKYPDIIKPIYQTENQYSKGISISPTYQFPRAKGKYIALCEGDDYWTDPLKLQKQVDFLEANPTYSLCSCRFTVLMQATGELQSDWNQFLFGKKNDRADVDLKKLCYGWFPGTQTVVFRKNALDLSILNQYEYCRDLHLIAHLLLNGRGTCLNFVGAVYRRHAGGIYSGATALYNDKITYCSAKEIYLNNKKERFLKRIYIKYAVIYFKRLCAAKEYPLARKILLSILFIDLRSLPFIFYHILRTIMWKIKQIKLFG
jgi:glycosyltransferase involved in cell wall biosynthesis